MPKAKTAAKAAAKAGRAVQKTTNIVKEMQKKPTQLQELETLKIVEVKREGGIDGGGAGTGGKLRVVIEGNSVEKLLSPEARKLAYVQRFDHGMSNAGIESEGGTYVTEEERAEARKEKRNIETWRIDFIITPML
jgi:hypothetical protein